MEAIEIIRSRGRVTARELAELLGVSVPMAHHILGRLEKKGIVKRIGGGRGRGKKAVWIYSGTEERDTLRDRILLSIGMALGWINSQERDGWWPLPGYSERSNAATIIAALVNAEVLGRHSLGSPTHILYEVAAKGLPAAEVEFVGFFIRLFWLCGDADRSDAALRFLQKSFREGWPISRDREPDPLTTAVILHHIFPVCTALSQSIIDTALNYLSSFDPAEIAVSDPEHVRISGPHHTFALAYATLALAEYGRFSDARRFAAQLRKEAKRKGGYVWWEDAPPEYLAVLRKDLIDRHYPTAPAMLALYLLGYENDARRAAEFLLADQKPDGSWRIAEDMPSDAVRTGIVTHFLYQLVQRLT